MQRGGEQFNAYSFRGLGEDADPGLALTASNFWAGVAKLNPGATLREIDFPTRASLNAWAYSLYLEAHQQNVLPRAIIIIPAKLLAKSWATFWEGTAWYEWQLALVKLQADFVTRFVVTHELGHLLGLPDHWWPPNCIMAWFPPWLVPLATRTVCGSCRKKLEDR